MKSLIQSLLILLFIVVGGPILFIALLLILTGDGMCGNDAYAEVHSPDHRYKAIIFQRDCGATTDFSTQISILKMDAELKNKSGNVFVTRGHPDTHAPELTWLSNTELLIHRELDGTEFKAESSLGFINKIQIRYTAGSS